MSRRREDRTVAALIAVWSVAIILAFLAYASLRGFDDSMCRSWGACEWRDA